MLAHTCTTDLSAEPSLASVKLISACSVLGRVMGLQPISPLRRPCQEQSHWAAMITGALASLGHPLQARPQHPIHTSLER